jgi:CheY-like chemotaxis protein
MARILVIDDNTPFRELLALVLLRAGYEVADAADGLEGVRMFRQKPADLVIMDIFMPEKEGMEAIQELRRDFPEVKIIAITGGGAGISGGQILQMAREFGAIDGMQKPFDIEKFLEAVEKALRQAG